MRGTEGALSRHLKEMSTSMWLFSMRQKLKSVKQLSFLYLHIANDVEPLRMYTRTFLGGDLRCSSLATRRVHHSRKLHFKDDGEEKDTQKVSDPSILTLSQAFKLAAVPVASVIATSLVTVAHRIRTMYSQAGEWSPEGP